MFTGIIETVGKIKQLTKEKENLHIIIESEISSELKVDQSVSHDGVCLTVVKVFENAYEVTAIQETLDKTNLKFYKEGAKVNLERAMKLGARLDGHIVQGHVDCVATCVERTEAEGSWMYKFEYDHPDFRTVEKGSITVNGVSLTVVDSKEKSFRVAIIPYTFNHTNFQDIEKGTVVNLEFDIIGKYVANLMTPYLQQQNDANDK